MVKASLGRKVPELDLLGLFLPGEGELVQLSGKIGNGKTLLATEMVYDDLRHGEVVYTNWPIKYEGYDERDDWFRVLRNLLFFKRRFYNFPKENLKRIVIDDNFSDTISSLNNCKIYLDEGHVAFDSYEMAKMSMKKRAAILHTRHFNRTIVVISQRPTAIHATIRDNVNVFIKCEKLLTWPFLLFRRTYTQKLDGSGYPDFDEDYDYRKLVVPKKKVLEMYSTRYLGDDVEESQRMLFDGYDLSTFDKLFALYLALGGRPLQRAGRVKMKDLTFDIPKKDGWDEIKKKHLT